MKDNELKKIIKEEFITQNNELMAGDGFSNISKSLSRKTVFKLYPKLVFIVICLITMGIFIPSLFKDNQPSEIDDQDRIDITFNHENLSYVVYTAAKKTLDNKSLRPLSFNMYTTLSFDRVEYPFDFIKITNPYRFEIDISEGSGTFIEEQVGFGIIEVIVTEIDFLTQRGNDLISYYPNEMMIIFKGVYGIYSCLTNGGQGIIESGNYIREFSTHKFVQGDNIVKDGKLESIKIFVNMVNNNPTLLSFENWEKANYTEASYFPMANSYKKVLASELYKIMEIKEADLFTLTVTIDFIIDKIIHINLVDEMNLIAFSISEHTEIVNEDGSVGTLDKEFTGTVMISYRKYFDDYNPKHVIVEKVVIMENNK